MIRRYSFWLGVFCSPLAVVLVIGLLFAKPAAADALYSNADLIDPSIFLNSASMNASAIQSFLISKGGALANFTTLFDCASTGTTSNSMYVSAGAPCGQIVPASTIIYYASQIYGINPQVVLATLQKEENLVTDPSPSDSQYGNAMGYGCGDTSGCGTAAGFLYQIDNGVYTLRFNYERANGNMTWWFTSTSWVCGHGHAGNTPFDDFYEPDLYPGHNVTFYDGNAVAYATYTLANPSTSSLYCYTPHAYNNPQGLYGLPRYGTTGMYYSGSYNFVQDFDAWFGSSTILPELEARYTYLASNGTSLGTPTDDGFCTDAAHDACWQGFQNGYIVYSKATGAWESYGSIRYRWAQLGYQKGEMGYPDGPVICGITDGTHTGCYQQFQNGGYIVGSDATGYWESLGSIRIKWGALSFESGVMGYPMGGIGQTSNGGYYQQYEHGYIVGSNATGWWESMSGPVRNQWGAVGFQAGRLGFPTADPDCATQPSSGCKQDFQGGTIYWTSGTGAWQVWGGISGRYTQLSATSSSLGYPVTAESCGYIKNNGCFQLFQNGYIVGSGASGWWESMGGIRTRWGQLGFENGEMGYPAGPMVCTLTNSGCFQAYQNGYIVGTDATGYWESFGAIRGKWASLGYQNGALGYPTGAITCSSGACSQTYEHGTIYSNPTTSWYAPS